MLARRGHTVVHQWCPSYPTGNGAVERTPEDPESFSVEGIELATSFARYTMTRRVRQEAQYGVLAARAIRSHQPDVALLSNIPLISLFIATAMLRRSKIPVAFWQQDVYSAAIRAAAAHRLGRIGEVIGAVAARVERHVARRSAAVVPIDSSFTQVLRDWGVAESRIHVVPNWAPLAELPTRPKDNAWAATHGLADGHVVLYTGTLGLKHDPSLLADAAESLGDRATVAVVSQGLGRELLEKAKVERQLDNLLLFDFQPYGDLPDIMASADVLVALLEPHASVYSVPSKVLTYLCAARPIVAVIPPDNSVARIVMEHDAGRLVAPGDRAGLAATLETLLDDDEMRIKLGDNARSYAEATFDGDMVAARFEQILVDASAAPSAVNR